MKITVQSSKAVKPDYGSNNVAPSTTNIVPLSVLDKVNFNQHISDIFFFHPPAPSSHVLERGLARALAVYREWAGRLVADDDAKGGNSAILLNDAGARFVEATADVALGSVMPLEPSPELLSLHPNGDDGAEELMLVQVTRFACGSFVVGATWHHQVADGRAARAFFVAWGKAVRGAGITDPVHHDRAGAAFAPRRPPRVKFEHRGVEFKKKRRVGEEDSLHGGGGAVVVMRKVHFLWEMVSLLKSRASSTAAGGRTTQPCTTFQCVAAHLWRCVTKARGLDDLDFGTGRPFVYMPGYLPEEGLVFIVPSSSGDGSIDVHVGLFSRAMDVFKNCCYSFAEEGDP